MTEIPIAYSQHLASEQFGNYNAPLTTNNNSYAIQIIMYIYMQQPISDYNQ